MYFVRPPVFLFLTMASAHLHRAWNYYNVFKKTTFSPMDGQDTSRIRDIGQHYLDMVKLKGP
jgi:hypothetical protein